MSDAIVNPIKGKHSPDLGPLAVMVSSDQDLRLLCRLLSFDEDKFKNLMMSRVYFRDRISLTGPIISAPYAVMVLESLRVWGANQFVFFGWCGSISHNVKIGDIVISSGALIDEGTSKHYGGTDMATPSPNIVHFLREILTDHRIPYHEGLIWTTDAIFRETVDKVKDYQTKDAIGVEMELSALFTAGRFRNVETGALLIVSDELASLTWKPGFKDERFKQNRQVVLEAIRHGCLSKKPI